MLIKRGRLSEKQREFYEKNGFVVIPKWVKKPIKEIGILIYKDVASRLVPDALLDECRQRFLDLVDGKVDKGGMVVMKDISLKDRTGVSNERLVNKVGIKKRNIFHGVTQ